MLEKHQMSWNIENFDLLEARHVHLVSIVFINKNSITIYCADVY